jgi:hypothetical protein
MMLLRKTIDGDRKVWTCVILLFLRMGIGSASLSDFKPASQCHVSCSMVQWNDQLLGCVPQEQHLWFFLLFLVFVFARDRLSTHLRGQIHQQKLHSSIWFLSKFSSINAASCAFSTRGYPSKTDLKPHWPDLAGVIPGMTKRQQHLELCSDEKLRFSSTSRYKSYQLLSQQQIHNGSTRSRNSDRRWPNIWRRGGKVRPRTCYYREF